MVFRTLLCSLAALAVAVPAHAQGSRAQPRSAYSTSDLAKLKWLEGSWAGTAADEAPVYERIRFADDSTVQITYYRDPGFTQEFGNGKLYLSVGRVYHTFGSNRWIATKVDGEGLFLVPQSMANNRFSWSYVSPDAWKSTMQSGVGGHQRVVVFDMKRVKP